MITPLAALAVSVACGTLVSQTPPATPPANPPATPAPKPAPKPADASKYSGFMELVNQNKEAFVKLYKKRLELKGQSPPQESTWKEYKELEEAYQKVSAKVNEYMAQKRWTDEDRAAMSQILSDELSKAVQ